MAEEGGICGVGLAERADLMAIVRSEPEVVDFLGDRRRWRVEGSCGRGVATRLATCQLCPTRTYLLLILVLQLLLCVFGEKCLIQEDLQMLHEDSTMQQGPQCLTFFCSFPCTSGREFIEEALIQHYE